MDRRRHKRLRAGKHTKLYLCYESKDEKSFCSLDLKSGKSEGSVNFASDATNLNGIAINGVSLQMEIFCGRDRGRGDRCVSYLIDSRGRRIDECMIKEKQRGTGDGIDFLTYDSVSKESLEKCETSERSSERVGDGNELLKTTPGGGCEHV